MATLREIKERGYMPNSTFIRILVKGGFSLSYLLLVHGSQIKKLQTISTSEPYKRPKRRYTLPKYKEGMKYYKGDEKYLRPTYCCNPRNKHMIAIANQHGAFEKSDKEYASAAFEWVKRNITLEILPIDTIEDTLKRGSGTCMHINSVLAALLRCGGIKTRYKFFAALEDQNMYENVFDPVMQQWYDALGYFSLEADVEAYIDGEWIPAHAGPTPERQAAMGSPITKFGESSVGTWFEIIPGTMFRNESLPYGIGLITQLLMRIGPGTVNNMNVNVLRQIEHGQKILAEKGGEGNYDQEARRRHRFHKATTCLKQHDNIVFAD